MRLGDRGDHRVGEQLTAPGQRAPRLGDDPVLGMEGAQLLLLQQRVELDLVDRRRDAGLVDDPPQVLDAEVPASLR
jgi:hypothetical protein